MNDEIVSCIPMGDGPYMIATTKSGKVFIGRLRSGLRIIEAGTDDAHEIVWHRATSIPIKV
jgi:hypothetical protein